MRRNPLDLVLNKLIAALDYTSTRRVGCTKVPSSCDKYY
jgi:hypothetical protein